MYLNPGDSPHSERGEKVWGNLNNFYITACTLLLDKLSIKPTPLSSKPTLERFTKMEAFYGSWTQETSDNVDAFLYALGAFPPSPCLLTY
jgi:hypothetical protein